MGRQYPVYTPAPAEGPLRQGELVTGLIQVKLHLESIDSSEPAIDRVTHPFAVVMTQDCDLDWDFKARQDDHPSTDKLIPNVLFCEVQEAASIRGRDAINSNLWGRIKRNKDERYQFLEKVAAEQDAAGEGFPELAVDFKRFFTIPTGEAYHRLGSEAKRRSRLVDPYLQHFVQRFYHFQLRIALPEEHYSE